MTMINDALVPGVKYYFEGGWIHGILVPNPPIYEHVHRFNEIVMMIGSDPENPEYLGGELFYYVNGQEVILNKTGAMFIPAGVKHGPMGYNKFEKDHMMAGVMLGAGSLSEGWGDSGVAEPKKEIPKNDSRKDFTVYKPKQYVREVGHGVKNCTSPCLTLMSDGQVPVPAAIPYVNLCWIHDVPDGEAKVREHQHKYNELLVHFGGDTKNPFELGAEIEFGLCGKKHVTNKTSAVYLPQEVKLDYLKWNKVTRPHLELSIIFDCGDAKKIYGEIAAKNQAAE